MQEYEQLACNPKQATKFINRFCWPNYQRFCPKCKSRKVAKLSADKRKCLRCNFTFTNFTHRYLGIIRVEATTWLRIIKLFEMEVKPDEMAYQLKLSYNTLRKAITAMRLAILANSLDGPYLIKHFSLNELLKQKKIQITPHPIFGLIEEKGQVFIDFLPDMDINNFIHLKLNFLLPSKKIGQVIYTAPVKQYLSLMLYDQNITKTYKLNHKAQYIPLDKNKNFWPFAKQRLSSFRTTNSLNFLLYCKELEFRYNFKRKDFFIRLLKYLTTFYC
ncbi:MAG: hypothetical protein Q9M37_08665 [Desulfonauticus sp.]|nr:hypothetical protein [Desulfonauticus sp.]